MSRSRAEEAMLSEDPMGLGSGTVRIGEECLELDVAAPGDIMRLRRWIGRVNGPAYPQPFLVEGPPGHFRLYVGGAAERIRTAQGIR